MVLVARFQALVVWVATVVRELTLVKVAREVQVLWHRPAMVVLVVTAATLERVERVEPAAV